MNNISRYEPWSRLNQLFKEMERSLEPRAGLSPGEDTSTIATVDWIPTVDIKEEKDRFVLLADIPGVDPKDIDISMENGVLTIKGERRFETEQEREDYKRIERARGTFYRRFSLPDTADAEKISAKGRNGVLEIVIPKHERTKPRKIAVSS